MYLDTGCNDSGEQASVRICSLPVNRHVERQVSVLDLRSKSEFGVLCANERSVCRAGRRYFAILLERVR